MLFACSHPLSVLSKLFCQTVCRKCVLRYILSVSLSVRLSVCLVSHVMLVTAIFPVPFVPIIHSFLFLFFISSAKTIRSVLGNAMTPSKVFTALALFNQLRFPLYFFPTTLASLADAFVSVSVGCALVRIFEYNICSNVATPPVCFCFLLRVTSAPSTALSLASQ